MMRLAPDQDRAEPCPRCGATCRPTLLPGSGPHGCKAVCSACGRFLRWISLLAPSERLARKMKARLAAMSKYPPSQAQLEYLRSLGDAEPTPQTMAEASERIDDLVQQRQRR